jgi:hypothetical protein
MLHRVSACGCPPCPDRTAQTRSCLVDRDQRDLMSSSAVLVLAQLPPPGSCLAQAAAASKALISPRPCVLADQPCTEAVHSSAEENCLPLTVCSRRCPRRALPQHAQVAASILRHGAAAPVPGSLRPARPAQRPAPLPEPRARILSTLVSDPLPHHNHIQTLALSHPSLPPATLTASCLLVLADRHAVTFCAISHVIPTHYAAIESRKRSQQHATSEGFPAESDEAR